MRKNFTVTECERDVIDTLKHYYKCRRAARQHPKIPRLEERAKAARRQARTALENLHCAEKSYAVTL